MLKQLGRRLTILNVLISGAILIAMALASLGVVEHLMTVRNENELQGQMGMLISAVRAEEMDGARVKLAMPGKYMIYVGDSGVKQKLLEAAQTVSDSEAQMVLTQVREQLAAAPTMTGLPLADRKLIVSSFIRADEAAQAGVQVEAGETLTGARVEAGEALPGGNVTFVRMLSDYTLSTVGDKPYRIAVSAVGTGQSPGDVLMVMQDRTEEFGERDRLRLLFAACVLGGLVLIVFGSLFFSAKAVAPIEASIQKQRAFVAAASHELRTPIASLRANAEVLKDAELGEYAPYLTSVLGESEKMSRLVSDLLSLARADAGELPVRAQPVDVAEVARDSMQLIAPLAEQGGLTLTGEIQPALITGDPDRLRQVLIALMDNAVRYTPAGGMVRISTGRRERRAWVQVEDSGPGIPDEHKERVFDRFYRLDGARSREHGGAGLGLSIARELIGRMGGEIRLSDREGGGCVFHIGFPLAG